ncbi:MAG: YwqG family protein [Oscillospiraceae bacterium]|nr:YwqG family protein [Oscillospiraceae bacterium]
MKYKKILKSLQKNAVRIRYAETKNECPTGASKIGGKPDLPADFEWYYFNNRPLSFLAQINCEEAKPFDKDGLLPSKGILYFFNELDLWGYYPRNKDRARVYYYQGDISDLVKTDFPDDLDEDFIIPEFPVSLSSEINLPDWEEYFGSCPDDLDDYNNAKYSIILKNNSKDFEYIDYEDEIEECDDFAVIHKLLGYANVIQNDMLLECEKVANGIYCGNSSEISESDLKRYNENRSNWQLLLQLGTIEDDNFEYMWGDCGRIYFYIRKDDLANRNFDDCWLILQCG